MHNHTDAKIVFTDGKSKIGLAETSFDDKVLYFKASKNAEAEKIDAAKLLTITYLKDDTSAGNKYA